jgi:hypothetical protein
LDKTAKQKSIHLIYLYDVSTLYNLKGVIDCCNPVNLQRLQAFIVISARFVARSKSVYNSSGTIRESILRVVEDLNKTILETLIHGCESIKDIACLVQTCTNIEVNG